MLLVDLEKRKEGAQETSKSDKEIPTDSEFFQAFIVALFFALVAVLVAWFFDLNIKLFVTPYPEYNNNIAKHVATGVANPTTGLVGVFLGVVFVFFAISTGVYYLDCKIDTTRKKKLLKLFLTTTILSGVSAVAVGGLWWPAKYAQAQAYNNSPAASCLNLSNDADYVDGKCIVSYDINVVDSMFAYSEKKEAVKEIDGKYVKGTEYTVAESGKSYGNTHKPNDKVFISDDEFVNGKKKLRVGDSAYTDYAESTHLNSDKSYSNGNALRDDKKYVIHFTQKEHKVNVIDDAAPPKIRSIGSKISVEGNDYTYVDTKSESNSLSESHILTVRSDVLNK